MNIRGFGTASSVYAAFGHATSRTVASGSTVPSASSSSSGIGNPLRISSAGQALASASPDDVQRQLDAIKAKPATQRSSEDTAFLMSHDTRLQDISKKDPQTRTAEDLDYLQKASGFVNTMSQLSPDEKKLYDELVSKGNTDAANGLALVALDRMGSNGNVTLKNGKTFDPQQTEITAAHVRDLFSQLIVDPSGQAGRQFEALASYLDGRQASVTGTA